MTASVADLGRYMEARCELSATLVALTSGHRDSTVAVLNSLAWELAHIKATLKENRERVKLWQGEARQAQALLTRMVETNVLWRQVAQELPQCPYLPANQGRRSAEAPAPTQRGGGAPRPRGPPERNGRPLPRALPPSQKPQAASPAVVTYLTLAEFESTPKYMLGRLSYAALNSAIDEYNQALAEKYDFYARGFQAMSSIKDKKRYQTMKALETPDTRGRQFVVAEDLKTTQSLKTEAARKNVFTILRHFRRVKEIRGPGTTLRYCALA